MCEANIIFLRRGLAKCAHARSLEGTLHLSLHVLAILALYLVPDGMSFWDQFNTCDSYVSDVCRISHLPFSTVTAIYNSQFVGLFTPIAQYVTMTLYLLTLINDCKSKSIIVVIHFSMNNLNYIDLLL